MSIRDNNDGSNPINNLKNNEDNQNRHPQINETIQQFIKVIDIDDLPPKEISRIITAIGSKNMAYYLALIVNLENRSRKLSPQAVTKILSTKAISAPATNPKILDSGLNAPNLNR